jgi:hypothetical protein
MNISARELNRATLGRQFLLPREALGVSDAVRRAVALQAQQPASPYLALWNRLTAFDPADLDAALAGHTLVKATLMRITLHVVHADDHPAMHTALQPTLRGTGLRPMQCPAIPCRIVPNAVSTSPPIPSRRTHGPPNRPLLPPTERSAGAAWRSRAELPVRRVSPFRRAGIRGAVRAAAPRRRPAAELGSQACCSAGV